MISDCRIAKFLFSDIAKELEKHEKSWENLGDLPFAVPLYIPKRALSVTFYLSAGAFILTNNRRDKRTWDLPF